MDDPTSPVQVTPPPSPQAFQHHKLEIARYKSELAAYTLRQWNIARLDAEKKESDRRRRRMHALAQYAAAGMTSPSPAHSRPPPPPDGAAQYHHSAGGHILMTTRRESRRSFTTSATTTPSSSYLPLSAYQPHHHAHQQPQPHALTHTQYAQHLQRLESAHSNSEPQRSSPTNHHHPTNTHPAPQMHHPGSPTYVQPDSNAVGLSQSMSAMAIDPPSRRHTRAYEHAACPSSPGHWHPPQHPPSPPHPRRACTSPSAARAAGRHLGTQLLTMTPVNHDHSKTSGSALTSDEDSPTTDEPSTEAQDGMTPPDVLVYRPNATHHHHRASMPPPQRMMTEERDAHMEGLKRSITANPGGEGYRTADNVRYKGGSPGGALTIRTPGVRI